MRERYEEQIFELKSKVLLYENLWPFFNLIGFEFCTRLWLKPMGNLLGVMSWHWPSWGRPVQAAGGAEASWEGHHPRPAWGARVGAGIDQPRVTQQSKGDRCVKRLLYLLVLLFFIFTALQIHRRWVWECGYILWSPYTYTLNASVVLMGVVARLLWRSCPRQKLGFYMSKMTQPYLKTNHWRAQHVLVSNNKCVMGGMCFLNFSDVQPIYHDLLHLRSERPDISSFNSHVILVSYTLKSIFEGVNHKPYVVVSYGFNLGWTQCSIGHSKPAVFECPLQFHSVTILRIWLLWMRSKRLWKNTLSK